MPVLYSDASYQNAVNLVDPEAFKASFGDVFVTAVNRAIRRAPALGLVQDFSKRVQAAQLTGGLTGAGSEISPVEKAEGQKRFANWAGGEEWYRNQLVEAESIEAGPDWWGKDEWDSIVRNEGYQPSDFRVSKRGVNAVVGQMLIDAKNEERKAESAASRAGGFTGLTAALAAEALATVADPTLLAANFVPVVAPARVAKALSSASGVISRATVRLGVGAAEGAVGAALTEIPAYVSAEMNQTNYGIRDFVTNVAFGAGIGAGLHATIGAGIDAIAKGTSDFAVGTRAVDNLNAEARERVAHTAMSQAMGNKIIDVDPLISFELSKLTGAKRARAIRGSDVSISSVDGELVVTMKSPTGDTVQLPDGVVRYVSDVDTFEEAFTRLPKLADRIDRGLSTLNREILDDLVGADQIVDARSSLRRGKQLTKTGNVRDYGEAYRHLVRNGYIRQIDEGVFLPLVDDMKRAVDRVLESPEPVFNSVGREAIDTLRATSDAIKSGRLWISKHASPPAFKVLDDAMTTQRSLAGDIRYHAAVAEAADVKLARSVDDVADVASIESEVARSVEELSNTPGFEMRKLSSDLADIDAKMQQRIDAESFAVNCVFMGVL